MQKSHSGFIGFNSLLLRFRVRIALIGALLFVAPQVSASFVVGLISNENAADVMGGAHRFLEQYPQHTIQLRTTEQFVNLSMFERKKLFESADLVFAGGVFGDAAERLHHALKNNEIPSKQFVAVHSDRRLVEASSLFGHRVLQGADLDFLMKDLPQGFSQTSQYRDWVLAKIFWAEKDRFNMFGLFSHLYSLIGETISVPDPQLHEALSIYVNGQPVKSDKVDFSSRQRWVALLDYDTADRPGERELLETICSNIQQKGYGCLWVLAKWGAASVDAAEFLNVNRRYITAVVSVQNFVVGGGEGRSDVNLAFTELDVPILKALRLTDSTQEKWVLSEEGLRWGTVHYRVAMPELQGIIEPIVVAALTDPKIDSATGLKYALSQPIDSQINLLAQRLGRWLTLQAKSNQEKKVAIIYYNHPPGRHNIGADNLNVPASLFEILHRLKRAGYNTGDLPKSEEALLDILQEKGLNLPEDRKALTEMSTKVVNVSLQQYNQWFKDLPNSVQKEMVEGPLGYLNTMFQRAVNLEDKSVAKRLFKRVIEDLKHVIEGVSHPSRERVLRLLAQLETIYAKGLQSEVNWSEASELVTAIAASGVEGFGGWGKAPGRVMVHNNQILIPGIQFGHVFIGPQPPRGWELNEELLHANLSFPPPHQYLAFYQWIRNEFKADALVHLGRHSTYEFLPRHRVGMSPDDYSMIVLGDLPSIYPYIVDGVGEGIQAKRRGFAVMIDHLTPPLDSTELYDRLLELRQLVESYEAAPESAGAMRQRAITEMKSLVEELKLEDELISSMSGELDVRGITEFDQVDDELLVHEIGHYLTKLQEDFMPLGLHVFGRDWETDAINTMLRSMLRGEITSGKPKETNDLLNLDFSVADSVTYDKWQEQLAISPKEEIAALLNGLNGRYVLPGKGNDPIRTPEALPTGRNFFALDGSLIPSRLGYSVGVELAEKARRDTSSDAENTDAIVLWASDVVRDEGAMIAFGFDMLGITPEWSSRGIVKGLRRLDVTQLQEFSAPRIRRDVVITTSGLFRDLYGAHLVWLERAVLMALDASSDLIREKYPALVFSLNAALAQLGEAQAPARESLDINRVAAHWVDDARAALLSGLDPVDAGKHSVRRIFGDAPGSYGAGVNRMVERSGSWNDRSEIAKVYLQRMGHAYGATSNGEPAHQSFKQRLSNVSNTYLGRSSNLYGLLDNNDAFDYLGGMSLAAETLKGKAPNNFILFHPDANSLSMEPLKVALLSELRGRFLNPQWLSPLMEEGYSGARTMGSEFIEYLWGWQVTNPDVIKSWVWDEVKSVYIDDKLNLGLDAFLENGHNAHVKSNMLAVMLVAAQKEFWQTDEATIRQIADKFTDLLFENGLPGSGHTSQDHPMFTWLESYLAEDKVVQLQQLLAATKTGDKVDAGPTIISEITFEAAPAQQSSDLMGTKQEDYPPQQEIKPERSESASENERQLNELDTYVLATLILLMLGFGLHRGMRVPELR